MLQSLALPPFASRAPDAVAMPVSYPAKTTPATPASPVPATHAVSRHCLLAALTAVLVALAVTLAACVVLLQAGTTASAPAKVPDNKGFPSQDCVGGPADCLVGRDVWLAAPSKPVSRLRTPVSLVVMHHTDGVSCADKAHCVRLIRQVQDTHMLQNKWSDIGFNFLVGGDGLAYLGRGWDAEGAHTRGWNNVSIGVAAIGTFTEVPPPAVQRRTLQLLLDWGMSLGKLAADYSIVGACQVRNMTNPGRAFMQNLRDWPRWNSFTSADSMCAE